MKFNFLFVYYKTHLKRTVLTYFNNPDDYFIKLIIDISKLLDFSI